MPVLTFPKSASGAIVRATIWPDREGLALLAKSGQLTPAPVVLDLLIDTGADVTVIDESKIAHWMLPYAGIGWAQSMGGRTPIRRYQLSVTLSGREGQPAWNVDPLKVTAQHAPFVGAPYAGLLGRDVLNRSMFVYNGFVHECTLAY